MCWDDVLKIKNLGTATDLALTCHDSSSVALHQLFQRILPGGEGAVLCKRMAGAGREDPPGTLQTWAASALGARLQQAPQHALGPTGLHQTAIFR